MERPLLYLFVRFSLILIAVMVHMGNVLPIGLLPPAFTPADSVQVVAGVFLFPTLLFGLLSTARSESPRLDFGSLGATCAAIACALYATQAFVTRPVLTEDDSADIVLAVFGAVTLTAMAGWWAQQKILSVAREYIFVGGFVAAVPPLLQNDLPNAILIPCVVFFLWCGTIEPKRRLQTS